MPAPHDLTRHHALPRRYLGRDILSGREGRGYTALDLFKFYSLISSLLFILAFTYIKYLDLFADALKTDNSPLVLGARVFAGLTVIPLVLALIALEGFIWWASGALVGYTRWQRENPRAWGWFWFIVLNFLFWVEFDPLDQIHRAMSRNGLFPAPNLILLFSGKVETFEFQWGYFLLWMLFWFLVAITHVSYLADGLKEAWFYIKRINRYGASVLTGFRGTGAVALSPPVTYPAGRQPGASAYPWTAADATGSVPTILIPRLNTARLTDEQAAAILAADASGAISAAPQQRSVLLVDLGAFWPSPALLALRHGADAPLIVVEPGSLPPAARRDELIVPLTSPEKGWGPAPTLGRAQGPVPSVAQEEQE